jgi:hypothetical protein
MSSVREIFGRRLGAELLPDECCGYRATIHGKDYYFPSLTHAFDASRGNLSEYVANESSKY